MEFEQNLLKLCMKDGIESVKRDIDGPLRYCVANVFKVEYCYKIFVWINYFGRNALCSFINRVGVAQEVV